MSEPNRTEKTLKIFRYDHGGSRIYFEDGDARELVADTYQEKDREVIFEAIRATVAPAPAQAREEEALLELPRYNPRPAYGTNALPDMRPDPQYGQWVRWSELQAALAALRSRQNPQAVDIPEDEMQPHELATPDQLDAALLQECFTPDKDDTARWNSARSRELIRRHDLAAAPQPSPQGEDAEAKVLNSIADTLDGLGSHEFCKKLRAIAVRLREENRDGLLAKNKNLEAENAQLRARLASAQSSSQGEEARKGIK